MTLCIGIGASLYYGHQNSLDASKNTCNAAIRQRAPLVKYLGSQIALENEALKKGLPVYSPIPGLKALQIKSMQNERTLYRAYKNYLPAACVTTNPSLKKND